MRPAPVLAALVVLAFLTQSAAASWSVNGDLEPDTPFDVSGARMWLDPDTDPNGMRVYFDAVYIDTTIGGNPNVGALGSRVILPGPLRYGAFLGVWKDCNRDGYIGLAETVVLDYQSALLSDPSVCPDGSRWNRAGLVTEFIHIAPVSAASSNPLILPRVIPDRDARIWGDFGLATARPEPDVDCVNTPLPAGTLDSTGALLMAADCHTNYNVARIITETDATLGLGIGFDGPGGHYRPDTDCDNPLNQQLDLYGDSYCNAQDPGLFEGRTGRRMFNVWDCDAGDGGGRLVDVRDPTARPGERGELSGIDDPQTGDPLDPAPIVTPLTQGGEPVVIDFGPIYVTDPDGTYGVPLFLVPTAEDDAGVYLQLDGVPPLAPSVNDSDGSLWDTRAHFNDGMSGCARNEGDAGVGEPTLNGASTFDPLRGKRTNHFTMTWSPPPAPVAGLPSGFTRGDAPWISNQSYGPPRGYPNGVVRAGDLKPANATYFSFYAYVGSAALAAGATLPNGGNSFYGSEICLSYTSGVHGGWDCDPDHWWNPDYGHDVNLRWGARPGQPYNMRDTDCLDGSLGGGSGVFVSISPFSDDPPCP